MFFQGNYWKDYDKYFSEIHSVIVKLTVRNGDDGPYSADALLYNGEKHQ